MGEDLTVVEGLKVSYSGLFKAKDLLKEINQYLSKKKYDKQEKFHDERVTSKGKSIAFEMEYKTTVSLYVKYVIKVEIKIRELKDIVVTRGTRKMKYDEGDVTVEISSKIETDLSKRWQTKPGLVFAGRVINKYLYPLYLSKEVSEIKRHSFGLRDQIKAFLNLYKF